MAFPWGGLRQLFGRDAFYTFLTKRMLVVALLFSIEALILFVFASQPLSAADLQSYTRALQNTLGSIEGQPAFVQVWLIYQNNLIIALQMLEPVLGQFTFALGIYNTARGVAVIAALSSRTPADLFVQLYTVPHTWLETSAYAVAATQALYLLIALVKGGVHGFDWNGLEDELRNVPLSVALVFSVLLVAAVFEVGESVIGLSSGWLFWTPFAVMTASVLAVIRRFGLANPSTAATTAAGVPQQPEPEPAQRPA